MAENLFIPENGSKKEKYETLLPQISTLIENETDLVANLANITSALHQVFNWWWVGFYWVKGEGGFSSFFKVYCLLGLNSVEESVERLGKEKKTQLVPNVEKFLGILLVYSATKSEIVVPIFDKNNTVVGVLDVDSERFDILDETDVFHLEKLVELMKNIL